jgi:hypothetical protein
MGKTGTFGPYENRDWVTCILYMSVMVNDTSKTGAESATSERNEPNGRQCKCKLFVFVNQPLRAQVLVVLFTMIRHVHMHLECEERDTDLHIRSDIQ